MSTKITVNGVAYDGVDHMPPDVRKVYDEALAQVPELADRDPGGVPYIVQRGLGPLQGTTVVRKKIILNGTTYEDEAAMPAEAREAFQQAMRAMSTSKPTVTNEIKMSFDPIEPAPAEGRLRWILMILGACVAGGLFWLLVGKR